MRLSAPRRGSAQQRQELWRRERAAVQTLGSGFPRTERLWIQLRFINRSPMPLADQSHILHAGAQAFFAFPCPYANCEGRFDLTEVVTACLENSVLRAAGGLDCDGMRFQDTLERAPCQLHMDYIVTPTYRRRS
jgi:hypothetical protein